jgi:hypothetical protein
MSRPGPGTFGSAGDDFANLIFDDAAITPIESLPSSGPSGAPYSGTFRPNEPLSAFDGHATTGTWTLTVTDADGGTAGELNSWALSPARECSTSTAPLPAIEGAPATAVTTSSAVLNGTLDPNGNDTTWAFEFGTTTAYGTRTADTAAGSGSTTAPISAAISGLEQDTTYHYRPLAFVDGKLITRGADRTLTTSGDPPETTITRGPKKKSKKSKAKFRFESSEPGSTFACRLKGKEASKSQKRLGACDSPKKYKNLDPGRYKFTVAATDAAGNTDPTAAKHKFEVR